MSPEFFAAIRNGIREAGRVAGTKFEWRGQLYSGSIKSAAVDATMQLAGYNSSADFILRASREQFLSGAPSEKQTITWNGVTLFIRSELEPGNEFSFVAALTRRPD